VKFAGARIRPDHQLNRDSQSRTNVTVREAAVPKPDMSARNGARWAIVDRIVASQHFRTSPRLCQFLQYVADCALRECPEEATEQQIGIRVFGRAPGFNSSEDSIVRTHARLLRQKLETYFAQEGIAEPIVVVMPKGHYLPVFTARPEKPAQAAEPTIVQPPPAAKPRFDPGGVFRRHPRLFQWVAVAALATAGLSIWRPWNRPAGTGSAVNTFWRPFLTGDPPIVIFSNALFKGDSTNGLSYAADPSDQAQGPYVDTYTGIGELASVYTLTKLFDAHKASFILKRSLLVTWDEAELRNLVFIGSRAENPSLRVLPSTADFSMVASADSAGVVNHNPNPGEPAVYSRPEHPLSRDYAILALLPGVQPGKRILIFSGLTTFGTQAAVDYVCLPETAAELVRKISGPKGDLRPFEAVLETTIVGGVPMQVHLVTIRVH
jgi:hypothetical protein